MERTLTVRLRAVADGYNRVIDDSARRTEEFAARGGKVTAWGDKAEATGRKLTAGLTLPILGAGAAVLATAGNYEAGMREVQALTSASGAEMAMLSEQAKRMGADTQFSATQAAAAMGQLVKGGFDARQTYQALPGVMQLAAAAGLDIASAADIATNVLSTFGLQVSELSRVNDVLAQTANSTDTDVLELGEAFKYVGPIARSAGLSVEDTAAILGQFAENGVRGSAAGTELRRTISNLLNPTDKAAALMARLGVTTTDASGQLLPMVDIVGQLHDAGASTSDMLTIFGDQTAGMVALVTNGRAPLQNLTTELGNVQGVAQNLADSKMGGLLGSWEQFKGSLETLAITLGEAGLTPLFTGLAQGAASLTDSVTGMPTGVQQVGLAVAGLAAASGPAIWGLGKLTNLYKPVVEGIGSVIGKLQGMRVQFALARMDGLTSGQALLSMFGPQAAILVGLAALAGAFWYARQQAQQFESSHQQAGDSAEALAESAGIALQQLGNLEDGEKSAIVSADDFRRANEDAILTLRELGDLASQQSYLAEIGYQLVLRGATPEQAMEQVKKLADAAGVEVPITLTIDTIGDFDSQIKSAVMRAKRVAQDAAKVGPTMLTSEMQADLDGIARAAEAAWKTDNIAGFVQILGEAETKLGDNSLAINYLTDQGLEFTEVAGLSKREASNLGEAIGELTSRASAAGISQQDLLDKLVATASEMDGGLTPKNLAAAAAMESAGVKAEDYGSKVEGAGDAAGGAIDPVTGLATGLDDQAQSAEDAEKAFKDYLDTLRGATDPFFAMIDAFSGNVDAQRELITAQAEYDAAIAEHGRTSKEAIDAENNLQDARLRTARSAQDVMIAAEELQHAVENGSVSLEDAQGWLFTWTAQGLITADTANALAAQFGLAALGAHDQAAGTEAAYGALTNLDGTTANTAITADTSQFDAAIASVRSQIAAILGMRAVWDAVAAIGGVKAKLDAVSGGKAPGDPVRVNPSTGTRYAMGGVVTGEHQVRLPGYGTDTVPTMLTVGEGVLSLTGMATLGGQPVLDALNAGRGMKVQGLARGGVVTGGDPDVARALAELDGIVSRGETLYLTDAQYSRLIDGARNQRWGVKLFEDGSGSLTMGDGRLMHIWNREGTSFRAKYPSGNPAKSGPPVFAPQPRPRTVDRATEIGRIAGQVVRDSGFDWMIWNAAQQRYQPLTPDRNGVVYFEDGSTVRVRTGMPDMSAELQRRLDAQLRMLPAFHTGGVLPGPIGQEAIYRGLGGETVRTPAQEAAMATTLAAATPATFDDSRLVDRLDRLETAIGSMVEKVGRPLYGEYHAHGVERPESPAQVMKAARQAQAALNL